MSLNQRRILKREMLKEAMEKYDRSYLAQDNKKMAMLRLYDIEKDFRDSIKPYKSPRYVLRDLLQPFRGLSEIGVGAFKLTICPLIIAPVSMAYFSLLYYLNIPTVPPLENSRELNERHIDIANMTLGVVLDGATQIFQGLIHVVKMPYTWLTQIPYRSLLTFNKGWQTLAENEGMKNLVKEYQTVANNSHGRYTTAALVNLLVLLEEKYDKAVNQTKQHQPVEYDVLNTSTTQFIQTLPKEANRSEDQRKPFLFERRYYFRKHSNVLSLFHHAINDKDLNALLTQDNADKSLSLVQTVLRSTIRKAL